MAEFVNLDAKWLRELSSSLSIEAGNGDRPWDAERAVRLIGIAQRLENLDEKLRNLESSSNQVGEFERGVKAERERIFGRTNLPLQSVEVSPELRAAVLKANPPVKKIPYGKSGFNNPILKPKAAAKRVSSPALQEILSGLKIDVSKLGVKG